MYKKRARARSVVASEAIGGGEDRGAGLSKPSRSVENLHCFKYDESGCTRRRRYLRGVLLVSSAINGVAVATRLKLAQCPAPDCEESRSEWDETSCYRGVNKTGAQSRNSSATQSVFITLERFKSSQDDCSASQSNSFTASHSLDPRVFEHNDIRHRA
ncbi:uncharacterized protein BDZ99DRAFT_478279 [Mytilinidion resinicola]|uniref:Uncharacterized protein n=1 Tax=Mytilinidion resinicola TaxID=574789 RepID=A0A6A6YG02_9PEZI|nr:uncharacterized protein BDZ99DRAFT_478279 [Mytilinidion resinicola]KAF2807731.1 hypothetical protein BDZ99DRAFT_478279 [Mytilinidion resinicola]